MGSIESYGMLQLLHTPRESWSYTSCPTIPSVTLQKKAFGDKQGELKGGTSYSVRALLMRPVI